MSNKLNFILITILTILFALASTAEAKRFGGGSSFGSKSSYSSPFKQKSTQNRTFSQQKAAATNQQRKQQLASRGGLMGILGGLALGGLLGALFFGGAFEGLNFFDFLIIGGLLWAVWWFIKQKGPAPMAQAQSANSGGFDVSMDSSDVSAKTSTSQLRLNSDKEDAQFTDTFSTRDNSTSSSDKNVSFAERFGMGNSSMSGSQTNTSDHVAADNEVILPDWFDQNEFLSGARSAYTLLQQAWDTGDLDTIKGLTTGHVFSEIARQFEQTPSQGATRIVQLNAELIDFNELEQHTEAAVLFDALLSETDDNGQQGRTTQIRELWHFVRGKQSSEPTWYLDGLQQLE